jgi:hypothetical protein
MGERLEEQRQAKGERDGDDEVENEMVFASMREWIRAVHVGRCDTGGHRSKTAAVW